MTVSLPSRSGLALIGQLLLILLGLVALYAFPPARGRMLLVPLTDRARVDLVRMAVAHGARLVAVGAGSGNLLVAGSRDELAGPLLRQGVLALAAPRGGCGDNVGEAG